MACSKLPSPTSSSLPSTPTSIVSSSSNEEIEDPLDIFPEEVWKMIFKLFKEPKHLLSCTRVCTTFEDMLKPKECTWLFRDIFSFLFPYLEKSDCLACRTTGKEWNKTVDGFLENHGFYRPYDEVTNTSRHTTLYLPLMDKSFGWTEFHNIDQIQAFTEKIGTPVRNPFIGRSLWVQFQDDLESVEDRRADGLQFWPRIFQFLSVFGKYVWYFSLGTFGTKNTIGRFIRILRRCLELLPNLKSLHIFGWINDEDNTEPDQLFDTEDEEWDLIEDELPYYFERKPLPLARRLERLEIEYMEDLPDLIYEHIITLHENQLKCLQLTRWNFLTLKTSLPNLKELHLKIRTLDQLNKFLLRLKSPVGKLNLDFDMVEPDLDMPRLFRIISDRFGETLRVLQMSVFPFPFKNKPENPWDDKPKLRTPLLQTLQLEGFNYLSMNSVLEVADSLQHLHIRHIVPESRAEMLPNEIIDMYQFMSSYSLYESNVWKKLPELKVLSSQIYDPVKFAYVQKFYHRQMYNFLEENKANGGGEIGTHSEK